VGDGASEDRSGQTGGALVAGVDGCRGGWAVIVAGLEPHSPVEVRLERRFEAVVAAVIGSDPGTADAAGTSPRLTAVAVDMPIGLPAVGPRSCDLAARALLGRRRASVFPAPVRATLGAADHAEACRRSRTASGRALSIQAFNLLPRIAEVDRALPHALSSVVVEAHPELAFLRLGGIDLPPKRSPEGRHRRLALLRAVLGPDFDLAGAARTAGVPLLDAVDAAALVATARRLAAGRAEVLGGETDPTGRAMRVVW
jgi:predicted RNase H-like nuclease